MAALIKARYMFNPKFNFIRSIKTSQNKRETSVIEVCEQVSKAETKKNWISYGFSITDKKTDRDTLNIIMFTSVTLGLVVSAFIYCYCPDYKMKDWAQREAFLQLRHREENNLPLVNPNLIEPSKISLPSDEELGDMNIII